MSSSDNVVHSVGVLTSGGDSSGMNAALRSVIRSCFHLKLKCYKILWGYDGLVKNEIDEATWEDAGHILQEGGTAIGTARSSQFMTKEGRKKATYNLLSKEIDGLVIIGGDGSLLGASILADEWKDHISTLKNENNLPKICQDNEQILDRKLKIVGVAGSIDNDMCGTDNTIGVDTALHRICDAIDFIATTASSHKRAFVLEVMGRNCGHLALMSAVATGADWVIIPEAPPGKDWETEMCASVHYGRHHGKRCTAVILAEGAKNRYGKPITATYVRNVLESKLDMECRVTTLGYVQRGGKPSAYDRYVGTLCGVDAVSALADPSISEPVLIGMSGFQLTRAPLLESVKRTQLCKKKAEENDLEFILCHKSTLFKEMMDLFNVLKIGNHRKVSEAKSNSSNFTIGIVSVGAPAPGMNFCLRALTRLALDAGWNVKAIHEGFRGLKTGNISNFDWMSVNGWAIHGGCMLQTNRDLPGDDIEAIAKNIEKHNIQSLIVLGGFEASKGILELEKAKEKYPALRISMLGIPATISNNVPCTEVSIGLDKALNNMISATDNIKQSSVGYCDRIFLVQVMGGYCGFLSLLGGLLSGAEGYFLHEEGVNLSNIAGYIEEINNRFSKNTPKLSLFVMNEKASKFYTLPVVRAIFEKETTKKISVRTSKLGSIQQGGNPTPLDRLYAGQFAIAAIRYLKEVNNRQTTVFLGSSAGEIHFTDPKTFTNACDFEYRRPKDQWWLRMRHLCNTMSHRPNEILRFEQKTDSESDHLDDQSLDEEEEEEDKNYQNERE